MGVVIVVKVTHTGSDMGVDSCCPNQTAGIIVYELIFSPGGGVRALMEKSMCYESDPEVYYTLK